MQQTSSKDTYAYKQGCSAARGENTSDNVYRYGTVEYLDWWQGYDDTIKDCLNNLDHYVLL